MSDTDTTLDQSAQGGQPGSTGEESPNIRQLREKAERVPALETELAKYKQGDMLREAGLNDLTDVQRDALFNTHKGESNPDALKATAAQLWPDQAQSTQTSQGQQAAITAEEQAAHGQVASAQTGSTTPGAQSTDEKYATAKNAAELTAIIRSEANNGGIPLATDIE